MSSFCALPIDLRCMSEMTPKFMNLRQKFAPLLSPFDPSRFTVSAGRGGAFVDRACAKYSQSRTPYREKSFRHVDWQCGEWKKRPRKRGRQKDTRTALCFCFFLCLRFQREREGLKKTKAPNRSQRGRQTLSPGFLFCQHQFSESFICIYFLFLLFLIFKILSGVSRNSASSSLFANFFTGFWLKNEHFKGGTTARIDIERHRNSRKKASSLEIVLKQWYYPGNCSPWIMRSETRDLQIAP